MPSVTLSTHRYCFIVISSHILVDSQAAEEMRELLTSLPEGWIRRDPKEISPNQPPYFHEPTGEVSWKNPNSSKIMKIVNENDDASTKVTKHKMTNDADNSNKAVKKLKLMLKAGAPLGAVEQKAKLNGVDMSLVLSSDEEGDKASNSQTSIPEILVKKYKRMLKAGLPMDRIQQLASVETNASPEEIEAIVIAAPVATADITKKLEQTAQQRRVGKFLRMQKAGIPTVAILNAARLQNFDVDEVAAALEGGGGSDIASPREAGEKTEENDDHDGKVDNNVAEDVSDNHQVKYFTLLEGNKIAFPSARGCYLTDLVRKMAHSIAKTSRFDDHLISVPNEMVIDGLTLFHALGALKGVQFARDEFNSTVGNCGVGMSDELAFSKRHAYAEMARSIGMVIPDSLNEAVDINGLDELVECCETANKYELSRAKALIEDGYYDFDSLHAMYTPGSFVLAKNSGGGGIDSVAQVLWGKYTQGKTILGKPMKYFQLSVRYIVPLSDGKATFAETVQGMEMFEGVRAVESGRSGLGLSFVPLVDKTCDDILLKRFSLRGKVYNRIVNERREGKTHSYMAYEKGCFYQKQSGSFGARKSSMALSSSGRVVLDLDAAIENGHSLSVGRDDMIEGLHMKMKEHKLHLKSVDRNDHASFSNDGEMILFIEIPEEYLALAWPTLVGFSMTSKSWGDVAIDGLKEIDFDGSIFEKLVLPDTQKKMIKALLKHNSISGGGFRDLVEGKGEGIVLMLFGEPGCGKTLTAEGIAELLRKPLYSVSMGTLGTTADELERRLGEILQLSARWDSLVLLDEADSFLEARSMTSSLERNAMVSVMLRLSEYHQGILFLTSNRIDSLDPAFQTRITLALRYEPLDMDGRSKVWENLLLKCGYESSMQSFDLRELSKPILNGREIKNALRLAMALAVDEHSNLTQEILANSVSVVSEYKGSMSNEWSGEKELRKKRNRWSFFS